jgi:hypothetical protein
MAGLAVGIAVTAVVVPRLIVPPSQPGAAPNKSLARPSSSPSTSASSPSPSASSPAPSTAFTAVTVRAADGGNDLHGVKVVSCATCVARSRVAYIAGNNYLVVKVHGVAAPGTRSLTVTYESDGPRVLKISANGSTARELLLPGAGDWATPAVAQLPVAFPAGDSSIKFFNDTGPAPDVDTVVIS